MAMPLETKNKKGNYIVDNYNSVTVGNISKIAKQPLRGIKQFALTSGSTGLCRTENRADKICRTINFRQAKRP